MDTELNGLEPRSRGVGWYLQLLRRRKWWLILPTILGVAMSVAYALSQSPLYRSTATILIEESEIPRDMVSSTVTTYAEKRLQVISRRVMATDSLVDIMRRFDLYAQERARQPVSVVAQKMRGNTRMSIVNAQVVDASGRSTQATVAFTLSFDHSQPEVAQRVVNELVSLYLNQNIVERRQQATETTNFLRSEAERIGRRIAQLESELAMLRERHVGSLPNQLESNRQILQGTEDQIRELSRRAQALQERKIYLESQLALWIPTQANGTGPLSPVQRLELARAELVGALTRYTPDHPDVRRLDRQVRSLEQETGAAGDPSVLRRERDRIQERLAAAREQYGRDHPDVARLTRELDGIEAELARAGEEIETGTSVFDSVSPATIQIRAQLIAADSELKGIAEERERLTQKLDAVRELLQQAPLVEQEYARITRELDGARGANHEIVGKLSRAQLAEAVETERRGERFTLVEPPDLPQTPFAPDRGMIMLVGLVLSLGTGAGLVTLTEAMDGTVRSADEIRDLLGVSPLVVVPHIKSRAEVVRARSLAAVGAVVLLGVVVLAASYVHTRVRPLDIVALQLQQRAYAAVAPAIERLR